MGGMLKGINGMKQRQNHFNGANKDTLYTHVGAEKQKPSEGGRTMVETLAVLAIIGVLTVGAFAGYRYSLEVIMANSIVNGVISRAVIIGQQRVLEHELNLKEFHPDSENDLIDDRFEVTVHEDYYGDGTNIQALKVWDIPQDVCEKVIKHTEFPDVVTIEVNSKEDGVCDRIDTKDPCSQGYCVDEFLEGEYHNTVAFIFGEGGYLEYCSDNADCDYCSYCNEGVCRENDKKSNQPCNNGAGCCIKGTVVIQVMKV